MTAQPGVTSRNPATTRRQARGDTGGCRQEGQRERYFSSPVHGRISRKAEGSGNPTFGVIGLLGYLSCWVTNPRNTSNPMNSSNTSGLLNLQAGYLLEVVLIVGGRKRVRSQHSILLQNPCLKIGKICRKLLKTMSGSVDIAN